MKSLILTLSVASAWVCPSFVHAADRTIAVSGECVKSVLPDRASLILTSEFQNADSKRAANDAARQYEAVRDRVLKLKLADSEITTVEYSVNEIREWERNKSVSKGFRARMGLQVVTSDVKRMGEAIDIASREGVRDVGQLMTLISPARMNEAKTECLKEAVLTAKKKAQKVAEALGKTVGDAVSVSETGAPEFGASPMPLMAKMSMDARAGREAAPPPVDAGKRELSVQVNAVFILK